MATLSTWFALFLLPLGILLLAVVLYSTFQEKDEGE
jgi:hypothetical protein